MNSGDESQSEKKTPAAGSVDASESTDPTERAAAKGRTGVTYSDGDGSSENRLLELFADGDPREKIAEALSNDPDWPTLYHLTPVRENLLSWVEFPSDGRLLEVGAGCGAVTGLFCERLKEVTAIELTERRAEIIRRRHRHHKNLRVIAGNVHDVAVDDVYDFVTSIGVLEYAGRFTESLTPYEDFLRELRSYLKPDGQLILAIENRFGLKYWAGGREDHTGRFFDSLEGYPGGKDVRTFGRLELEALLERSGFGECTFYYPLPDYKLPVELFSDAHLPTLDHPVRSSVFPFADLSQSREYLFNERLAMDNILANDSFPFFANSFLVFASRK